MPNLTINYTQDLDTVYRYVTDPDVIKRRSEAMGEKNIKIQVDEAGGTKTITSTREIDSDLPGFAKKLFSSTNTTYEPPPEELDQAVVRPDPEVTVGSVHAGECQHRRDLAVLLHLHRGLGVDRQVVVDTIALGGIERVEGVRPEQLVEFVDVVRGIHVLTHQSAPTVTPASTNSVRSRLRPARIRLFTVPSGWPSSSATSL